MVGEKITTESPTTPLTELRRKVAWKQHPSRQHRFDVCIRGRLLLFLAPAGGVTLRSVSMCISRGNLLFFRRFGRVDGLFNLREGICSRPPYRILFLGLRAQNETYSTIQRGYIQTFSPSSLHSLQSPEQYRHLLGKIDTKTILDATPHYNSSRMRART